MHKMGKSLVGSGWMNSWDNIWVAAVDIRMYVFVISRINAMMLSADRPFRRRRFDETLFRARCDF